MATLVNDNLLALANRAAFLQLQRHTGQGLHFLFYDLAATAVREELPFLKREARARYVDEVLGHLLAVADRNGWWPRATASSASLS